VTTVSEHEFADMLIVPEELVILCSEQMILTYGNDPENNFEFVLKQGEILKGVGRTPVYLCTQDMKNLVVTSREKINKQYN
jgi:hypothetical protein